MLRRADLLLLTGWCRARDMSWLPGRVGSGEAAVLLERRGHRAAAMLLVLDAGELRLLDAAGQELAVASDLQALLDALDFGVADPSPRTLPTGRPPQALSAQIAHAA